MEEQRSKRNVWLWAGGAVVVVLLALALAVVRPWSGHGGQTIAGGKKGNVQQQEAGGNQKGSSLPQGVAGVWEPIPKGLPSNPMPYSIRFRAVAMGETARVGPIELKVLGVRYADAVLPGQVLPGKTVAYRDSDQFQPLVAVDVTMRNAGSTPVQLWPVGQRFGFVEISPDGTLSAVGSAVNDQLRYRYEINAISTAITPSTPVGFLAGAPYRDVPAFLNPGETASFSVLVQPLKSGKALSGFADGKKQYGLTLSSDAGSAAVQGHEQEGHAWAVVRIGTLSFVWDASAYKTPPYPADPLPDGMEEEAHFARQQGVDITKAWGFMPGVNGIRGLAEPGASMAFEIGMESALGWAGPRGYEMIDPLSHFKLPTQPPFLVKENATVTKAIGDEIQLPNLANVTISNPAFGKFMSDFSIHVDLTAVRRIPSRLVQQNGKWTASGPWHEVPLTLSAANFVLVAENGDLLAFAEDPTAVADAPGGPVDPTAFPLGMPWKSLRYGESVSGTIRFELPYVLSKGGREVVTTPKNLGTGYVLLVGQGGEVFAAWKVDMSKVPVASGASE